MTWLLTARLVTFVTTILFSTIVFALSAALVSETGGLNFSGFALATSLLTVVTVVPIFVIDMLRKGTFFSYIIVEIVSLKVLWIFWLSSGSYAAWTDSQMMGLACSFGIFDVGGASQVCGEIKAVTAFSFLLWILLTAYTSTLLGLSIRAHSRGHSIWTTSVRDGALFYPAEKASTSPAQVYAAPVTVPHSHPPAPPQSLPNSLSQLSHGIPQV